MRTLFDRSGQQRNVTHLFNLPPLQTGNTFFVSSVEPTSSASGPGYSPGTAFLTIDQAVSACVASQGDLIVVMPNHVETISSAGGLACDVEGVTILGLGMGRNRPRIYFSTSTSADINIDAANVTFRNLVFDLTGIDALAAPLDVNAADFTLDSCEIEMADSGGQATLALLSDANASRLTVQDCYFYGSTDAGTATALRLVGGDRIRILRNTFIANFTTSLGAIDNNTTAMTNALIDSNNIYNRTASSTKAMVFDSSSTGILSRNMMQILSGTAPITGAAMCWLGNEYAATIATVSSDS